jgi:transcription elongation factor S-II
LIGTVVSKFKNHATVGPTAKALVKKWKKVAKGEVVVVASSTTATTTATATATTSSSAVTAASTKPDRKKPAAAQRRDSVNSATEEMQNEWASLQPYRRTTCQKLLVERATEVETAIHGKYPHQKQDYVSKARSLCFNIKKNIPLASQIVLGQIEANELVNMSSEQLASDEKRKEIEERTKKLMESKQLDWDSQNESKINEMCGIKGELLQASLFTWYVWQKSWCCFLWL